MDRHNHTYKTMPEATSPAPVKLLNKVFAVTGWHYNVPGERLSLHRTKEGAEREAVKLVSVLCRDLCIPEPKAPYMDWQEAMQRVRRKLKRSDSWNEDSAGVEITEMEVKE